MYGYNIYAPLNKEEIFKRVSEEQIFQIVIQEEIVRDRGVMYVAPYRSDENPDCFFEDFKGVLKFVDFASSNPIKSLDCIAFIQACYRVNYIEALKIINDKLNLGLGDNLGKVKDTIHEHGYVEEEIVKKIFKERIITFLPRQFNYKDKLFWSKLEITRQNLIEDEVFPVELYRFISKRDRTVTVRPLDVCYAYTGFVDINGKKLEDKVKIYRPNAHKEAKWLTNCSQNEIGSIQFILFDRETLVITKSYKDCRVLRNSGVNAVWFQNEGMLPSEKVLLQLVKNFKHVIVWFDNDSTGIANSAVVSEYINSITQTKIARPLFLPPSLLLKRIKDPSDYFYKQSKDALLRFIHENKLI